MTNRIVVPLAEIKALESLRDSTVLVFFGGHIGGKRLDANDPPIIYEILRRLGRGKRLDVILQTEGGLISAARRIAVLLRNYADEVNFLVPGKARSAGTLLCLAGTELVLGPLGELSPLDPIIRSGRKAAPDASDSISAEEIRQFQTLAANWFNLRSEEHSMQVFSLLSQHFFPTTLSAFFRADLYVRKLGEELLRYQLPNATLAERERIVDQLVTSYPDHLHSITSAELRQLGLNARAATFAEEALMYQIWQSCHTATLSHAAGAEGPSGGCATGVLYSRGSSAFYLSRWLAPSEASDPQKPATRRFVDSGAWELLT